MLKTSRVLEELTADADDVLRSASVLEVLSSEVADELVSVLLLDADEALDSELAVELEDIELSLVLLDREDPEVEVELTVDSEVAELLLLWLLIVLFVLNDVRLLSVEIEDVDELELELLLSVVAEDAELPELADW